MAPFSADGCTSSDEELGLGKKKWNIEMFMVAFELFLTNTLKLLVQT